MTAEHIYNTEASTLHNYIKQVKRIYIQCSFEFNNIHMDVQFECIRREFADLKIHLNVC